LGVEILLKPDGRCQFDRQFKPAIGLPARWRGALRFPNTVMLARYSRIRVELARKAGELGSRYFRDRNPHY
jgi:hypothetical protein